MRMCYIFFSVLCIIILVVKCTTVIAWHRLALFWHFSVNQSCSVELKVKEQGG